MEKAGSSNRSVIAKIQSGTSHSLGTGAYYSSDDYAGFMRRLAVLFVDTIVLSLSGTALWVAIITLCWKLAPTYDPSGIFLMLWIVLAWLYLVPLKRSRFRTVGYRLCGLMIVSTKGERPSLFAMTFRMLMWLFGPFNLLLDLAWLGADTEGQTLRDFYAGTYVLRSGADWVCPRPSHPIHGWRADAIVPSGVSSQYSAPGGR